MICGIDPGINGAIGILTDDDVFAYPMPITKDEFSDNIINATRLIKGLHVHKPDVIVLERVNGMAGQGRVSIYSFGCTYGAIRATCQIYGCKLVYVSPQRWKKDLGLLLDKKTAPKDKNERTKLSKAMSIAKCRELYPNVNLKATERSKNDSDGLAEAILIGHHYKYFGAKQ